MLKRGDAARPNRCNQCSVISTVVISHDTTVSFTLDQQNHQRFFILRASASHNAGASEQHRGAGQDAVAGTGGPRLP
jgi:hypothetical protein